MRLRRWRARFWAARLGLVALALNALVPIHLSFDLAAAFETPAHCGASVAGDSAERHLLALFSGHHGANGKSDEHSKHHACPVCSTLGALAGFVPPTLIALSVPLLAGLPATLSLDESESAGAPAAYHSRAPPLA
jgi:peptidoglycan/LPS O-acetylase OafA/YrhL